MTQSARCSIVQPKLFFSNDGGFTFRKVMGPVDNNPAIFVDYRGMLATEFGLVLNCFVCYPLHPGDCANVTFLTATWRNNFWTVYELAQIDWTTHCYLNGTIYSQDDSNNNLIAFDAKLGQITAGPLKMSQTIKWLACSKGQLFGIGDNLYELSLFGNSTAVTQVLDFGGKNITNAAV